MAKNWIKKNKVYFDFASTVILTIATTFALWKGYINQEKTLKLTEINYKPDFRVNYGFADTLSCDSKHREEVFMIELFNDGYKVDIRYTWVNAFIEINKPDTTIIIPINQTLCSTDYNSKTGRIVSFTIDDIFSKFDKIKEKAILNIEKYISKQKFVGLRLKYILKVSYIDYSNAYRYAYFEITDWYSPISISSNIGEKYFNSTKGGIPYFISDITEDFLSKKILE